MKTSFTALTSVALVVAFGFVSHGQTSSNVQRTNLQSVAADDLETMLTVIESQPPLPPSSLPTCGNFYSAQNLLIWPPLPGNVRRLSAWPLGGDHYLLDDLSVNYTELKQQAEAETALAQAAGIIPMNSGLTFQAQHTTNDLWLEITAFTNKTAALVIHRPWNDTNVAYDLYYITNVSSPASWYYLMRCISNNILVTNLCDRQGFFALGPNVLTVSTNSTPQQLAQLLVPPWVTVTNATFTGAYVARGTFAGGKGCRLPIDSGVILSTGYITNAIGPNNDTGVIAAENGSSDLASSFDTSFDTDLDALVETDFSGDAAVLEFDIISSNSFVLQFQYVFASEEYPECLSSSLYGDAAGPNDVMGIFVSTNRSGTQWIIANSNDIALVPGTTLPVCVNSIHGAGTGNQGIYVPPTNSQYYVDNWFTNSRANIQYDGMTTLLTNQTQISSNVITHIKIAIEDDWDHVLDSAVFIKAWSSWSPCQCP